jgi:hypothetical protein
MVPNETYLQLFMALCSSYPTTYQDLHVPPTIYGSSEHTSLPLLDYETYFINNKASTSFSLELLTMEETSCHVIKREAYVVRN